MDAAREIILLVDWETLPYDNFSPHEDIISDRLKAFSRLPSLTEGIVIVSITTPCTGSRPGICGNRRVELGAR